MLSSFKGNITPDGRKSGASDFDEDIFMLGPPAILFTYRTRTMSNYSNPNPANKFMSLKNMCSRLVNERLQENKLSHEGKLVDFDVVPYEVQYPRPRKKSE